MVLLVAVQPAVAGTSASRDAACWQRLLNDWYDGTIDNVYPMPCYHQAIEHIPAALQIYSSAKDDLLNAQAAAAAGRLPVSAKHSSARFAVKATVTRSAGSGGGSSLPVPLLVLGALAIAVLVAGSGGMVWRRRHPPGPDAL